MSEDLLDTEMSDEVDAFEPVLAADQLVVDVDGYEGPLDLLLTLARNQKVDITKISMLALAEQYLSFIGDARRLKLELAADYLVMAAWLTYMKSRLLIPSLEPEDAEPTGEEMAERLAFQLRRLEAMRNAAQQLMARHRLGIDVFSRGRPEPLRIIKKKEPYQASLYELLKAYSDERVRTIHSDLHIERLPVLSIDEARKRLEAILGTMVEWGRLESYLPKDLLPDIPARSALASTLTAGLELAREGEIELRQLAVFGPIYMRRRQVPRQEEV